MQEIASLKSAHDLQAMSTVTHCPYCAFQCGMRLAGESKVLDVTALPDTARICNCNGVSKGKIISAVKAGHRSLTSVCDATRAGTGCGSCKPHIQALLELASDGLVVNDPPDRVPVHC